MNIESPPSRGAWIEIAVFAADKSKRYESPPSRGAWIEITEEQNTIRQEIVAPLTGGVD